MKQFEIFSRAGVVLFLLTAFSILFFQVSPTIAANIIFADMLLEYKYYENYRPGGWDTPDRLRMMADTGLDSDSAIMKLEFDSTVHPLAYWGFFNPTDNVSFHDYGTAFNLPPDTIDFSAWDDKTYTFWDDADSEDDLDPASEDYTQFNIPAGTYRQLDLPQNISISPRGIISWDEVEYADYYKVRAQDVVNGVIQGGFIFDSGKINSDGSGRMSYDLGSFMDVIRSDDVVIYIVARETANLDNTENGLLVEDVEHIVNQSRLYFDPYNYMPLAGKTLYDDFSDTYIDGEKWRQRTFVREIVNGEFVSKLGNRSPGMSAEYAPGLFRNDLRFDYDISNSIHTIECDLTIMETTLDSAPNARSFGRVGGYFYNINTAGGATGDTYAYVEIGNKGNGGLEAYWAVLEVLSDDTKTKQVLGSGTLIEVGTLQPDVAYTVRISYDGDHTFSFEANGQSDDFALPYPEYANERDPVTTLKALSTGINAINGSNNGFVSAKFDNVYINDDVSVYDDFSASPINLSKWENTEWVREISNGSLRANIHAIDVMSQVSTYLTKPDASFVAAKARVESASQLSPGARGIARIQGYYYNDSRGPGSGLPHNGYEGDVFAQVRLQYDSDGSLRAIALAERYNDPDQTDSTGLLYQVFTTPIYFDTFYTLSIQFTGAELIFKCNGEQISYPITTPTYKPYSEHRALRTRLYLDPGESGYMKALFDDVYITKSGKMIPAIPLLLLGE